MTDKARRIAPVRIMDETLANKIAAGEVVERPASVVKELVENAIDAGATRILVRVVAAGRRAIEVVDNGHGMGEQDALLAIERHATSKIRKAEDLDAIQTMGFRGEALASIAAVSRLDMVTRREQDEAATRIRVDGGVLRDVGQAGAPVGTRIAVNRLYFNTPVRAKFLKGVTTELSHCIDVVQRHALAEEGVGFRFEHNDKVLLDIPENADLRERIALIWGLGFVNDMIPVQMEQSGFRFRGMIGTPALTRSQRSHQFFFLNKRPIWNRSLQHGFEEAYQGLLTVGRRPVGILLIETHPRFVDVNIHPTKREIRFRDEGNARSVIRDVIRQRLSDIEIPVSRTRADLSSADAPDRTDSAPEGAPQDLHGPAETSVPPADLAASGQAGPTGDSPFVECDQTEIPGLERRHDTGRVAPEGMYQPVVLGADTPLQLFDTYLLVPDQDRLLIIDQHALHERLNFEALRDDLQDSDYAAQQLTVPLLIDVPPSHTKLLQNHLDLLARVGIDIEAFGSNTFQVTAICHLYEEARIPDLVFRILDALAQGDLFDKGDLTAEMLRLTTEACRSSVKAGDKLSPPERVALLQGFKQLRPPYTCPHGRPIIVEITQGQMEKSFRRRQ